MPRPRQPGSSTPELTKPPAVHVRISPEMERLIATCCKATGMNRSEVVRAAMGHYLAPWQKSLSQSD